jgi:flagellar basal-body rod modification protein FlgD
VHVLVTNLDAVGAVVPNTTQAPAGTRKVADELGQDAFMKLLLAQLKNQDPLKPMEDKDFIAQLAQFNSLSQLTQINQALEDLMAQQSIAQGAALIGKTVDGTADDGSSVSGVVTGLHVSAGAVTLDVGNGKLSLSRVRSVEETPPAPEG